VEELQPTIAVLSAWQGKPLNYATLGRELCISASAAKKRVSSLAEAEIIRLLDPLPSERRHTCKSPKLYFVPATDSPQPPGRPPELAVCAMRAVRAARAALPFQARMIAAICRMERDLRPDSRFFYHGGYGKRHVELIVEAGAKRIGFIFVPQSPNSRRCWSHLKRAQAQDIIQAGFVLYPGRRIFFASSRLTIVPAAEFLAHYDRWIDACLRSRSTCLQRLARRYNTAQALTPAPGRGRTRR